MDKVPTWLKVDHWYHAFILVGVAGSAAALSVEMKGIANAHALLLFSGMFFWGIGEWINHPLQTTLTPGWKITGHPRNANLSGTAFDLVGLALIATGIYKIAQAE